MSSFPLHPAFYTLLPFLPVLFILKWQFASKTTSKILPPSPRKLPLLGHMHLLGTYPHRSLQKLAQLYGPMMMLQLGSVKTLVVSSAEAAQEIMKTQDLNFVNRPDSEISRKLLYDNKDVSVAPYGEYWRQLKSICVFQLLSNKRVQSIHNIRDEETELMVEKIREASQTSSNGINLSELFMTLTNDVICRAAFGRKYSEGESGKKFRKLMSELVSVLGGFDFGTFLPWLGWIDRVNGLSAKVKKIAEKMDEFLDRVLEEHLDGERKSETTKANKGNDEESGQDFAEVLLEIYKNNNAVGNSITRDSIKALLLVSNSLQHACILPLKF